MKNTNNQLGLEASGDGANIYVSGGLVILGFILYLNSISGEFLFDDWPLIKENTLIHSLANWKTILIDGYRPVRTLLLAVFYHFFQLNPVWYHTANIIIHIFASIAVFHFILILVQHRNTAIFAALIFLSHPIQTDSVSYISGMRDTLSGLLYVLSMYSFVSYRRSGRRFSLFLAVLFFVIGAFTKEMAATVIFSFFLYDFISAYESNRDLRLLVQLRSFVKAVWGVFRSSWILYLVLLLFFVFLVYYYIFMKSATPRVQAGGVTWYGGSILLNYLTIPKIIIYYIKQIVWPADLLVDYKFFPIIPQNPFEIEVILSLGAVAGILLGAFFLLQYNKIAVFGILWFFLTLGPALNILPHHEFMAEHYLYLPMVGVSLIFGTLFAAVLDKAESRRKSIAVLILFGTLIVAYSIRTIVRNKDWQNDLSITEAQLKVRPDSSRTLMELGYLYNYMNLPLSAEKVLKKSILITPGYGPTLNNLGVVAIKKGDYKQAINYFRQASETKVHQALKSRHNLGAAFMAIGKKEEGMDVFYQIIKRFPKNRNALLSLSKTYYYDGGFEKAAEYLHKTLKNRPRDLEAQFLLAELYRKGFKFKAAAKVYDFIMDIDPGNQKAVGLKEAVQQSQTRLDEIRSGEEGILSSEDYQTLANLYLEVQEEEHAVDKLREALEIYQNDVKLWNAYAKVLFVQRMFDKAVEASKTAVGIDPENSEAHLLLANSYLYKLDFDRAAAEIDFVRKKDGGVGGNERLVSLIEDNAPKAKRAEKLMADQTDDPEGRLLHADVLESLALVDKAIEEINALLLDFPNHQEAKFRRTKLLVKRNRPWDTEEAIRLLQSILEENPDHIEAQNLLGALYFFRLDNFESAYYHFNESLRSDPAQEDLGRIQRTRDALRNYIHAVMVDKMYLLPFIVDKKAFEKWLMPVASARNS